MKELLSREEFKAQVFSRDRHCCVICGRAAVDAHHILDRSLFEDGGYYLDNGASLCSVHHQDAEDSRITVEYLYEVCGITDPVRPANLEAVTDKWGKTNRWVKYPRTYHLPWSQSLINDDREIDNLDAFIGRQVVVTEKMDGEGTTMYQDYIHARSMDSNVHPSRYWVRALHGAIKWFIPHNMRVCGENMYATHSIHYENLESYFLVFNVWQNDVCISWDETVFYAIRWGLTTVPVIYQGIWDEDLMRELATSQDPNTTEGYVVRVADSFSREEFSTHVAKYVRPKHVQTDEHWMHGAIVKNELKR